MSYQLVDKRCPECKHSESYQIKDEDTRCPKCGKVMDRVFGNGITPEFKPGYFDGFEADPIYISSREQFVKECETRGLYQRGGDHCWDYRLGRKKGSTERKDPPPRKKAPHEIKKMREEAIGKAVQRVFG